MKKYIPIILGTGREGRQSEKVSNFIFSLLSKKEEIETEILDVRDYVTKFTIAPWMQKEETKIWQEKMLKASGLVIVMPEYNHGYPGELKIVLDQAHDEYQDKPVLLCGVSSGNMGGSRAVENILPILRELKLIVLRDTLYFPNVEEKFSIQDNIQLVEFYEPKFESGMKSMFKFIK